MNRKYLILTILAALVLTSCKSAVPSESEPTEDPVSAEPAPSPDPSEEASVEPSTEPEKEWEEPQKPAITDFVPGKAVEQVAITRVNSMPDIPSTYKMLDWRQKALDYDAYVFDWNASDGVRPLIWLDRSSNNSPYDGFGLYTVVGDIRQGPEHPGSHESINTIAAVMGAGLVGIDKTSQDGYNYPQMLQNYFSKTTPWKIVLNGTTGYAQDWWYNILPNLLYWGLCDVFPDVDGSEPILRSIADQFAKADSKLAGNYSWSWFDYGKMRGSNNGIPRQQDAAAGHAWVLLNAYRKFADKSYMTRAISAMNALYSQSESRFYEIVMPFGAYVAAVLDAEYGESYDVGKILRWTFEGNKTNGRNGWAVTVGTWGSYDISGLQGSITDGGGYAFQMNCYEMAWPLVPMVKYMPKFATTIGKWMLNNASASRLFFPYEIADENQACSDIKDITGNIIGYEGLRKRDRYGKIDTEPVAEGDGPSWTSGMPPCTMFSLYSTSPIGIFGAIISTTDVEGIISLDCNATDFYGERPFPCHLIYNPFDDEKTVTYKASGSHSYDLLDAVARDYSAKDATGDTAIKVPAHKAVLVYEIPAGTPLFLRGTAVVTEDGTVVAY